VTTGSFRGRLLALSIADILEFLRELKRPGLLSVTSESMAIGLYLRGQKVVHATSTRDADRLTEFLLRSGRIDRGAYDAVMRRAAAGQRIGRALVDAGALSPRDLMESRRALSRRIALSLFEWDSGEFVFFEGEEPHEEGMEVELPILDLIVEGIRSVRALSLFRERMPSPDWVFEPIPPAERKVEVALEPQEGHVLRLVDGTRTVGALAEASDFSDLEARRILFLLFTVGYLKMGARATTEEVPSEEVAGVLEHYNALFGQVHRALMREVGPIGEHLLERSLREMKEAHPVLFSRAALGGDGTLDGALLSENLRGLAAERRRETLVQGLNELLYSQLLVLRRTLGPEHEGRILRAFRSSEPAMEAIARGGR
jgi:hypothetical protein